MTRFILRTSFMNSMLPWIADMFNSGWASRNIASSAPAVRNRHDNMIRVLSKRFPRRRRGRMVRRLFFHLLLALLVALAFAPMAPAQTTPGLTEVSGPNMGTLPQEAVTWLEGLVRINTTNPPGNELAAANYIAGILEKEGIPHEVIEIAPGRAIVVARLNASVMPDASRSLLLVAHLDVVGVTREKWTVDPFAAITQCGYLYGRGVIDDKGMVIANLAAMIALKRNAVPLERDVIFLADDDEEQGGDASIKTVI